LVENQFASQKTVKGILISLRDELAPLETTRDSIATIYATLSRLIENKIKTLFLEKKTQISFFF